MKNSPGMVLELHRIPDSEYNSQNGYLSGAYIIAGPRGPLKIIASDARESWKVSKGWDHVSISCPDRVPTWEEMCIVKDLFFRHDETVIQFHPPKSEYVNHHPHVLHLWRDTKRGHLMPPRNLV